jgi:hypothetical protein
MLQNGCKRQLRNKLRQPEDDFETHTFRLSARNHLFLTKTRGQYFQFRKEDTDVSIQEEDLFKTGIISSIVLI